MEFHFDNDKPIYQQISSILEKEIVSGKWQPGDKLPSVRELALLSKTNPNTVQKALQDLEMKNLIYTTRTSGKFVSDNAESLKEAKTQKAEALCSDFLKEMYALGYSLKEILEMLQKGNT